MIGAVVLVLVTGLALRYATSILDKGTVYDERFIQVPIDDLIARGWSVETAIDFTETKGPTMIWSYAIGGQLVGPELNDLRLVSVFFFVTGVVPLLLLARRCGIGGSALPLISIGYILLPRNAAMGQLLMSEPSFIWWSLWLLWVFVWGFGDSHQTQRSIVGPVLVGCLLAVSVHLRIHAVAFAAAIVLVAFERDRWRSWPWWAACAIAGASRVPLMFRWGGLVSPEYQGPHGLGLAPASLTYLLAALVPMTALLLWPALLERRFVARRWMIGFGAGLGLVLALVARPSLSETMTILDFDVKRYLGLTALAVGRITATGLLQAVLLGALAVIGAAALGAMGSIGRATSTQDRIGVVHRLQFWTLVTGCSLYVLTNSVVYDRYLLAWAVLMPIVWVVSLPRRAMVAQGLLLLVIASWSVWRFLFVH
jgi:hypothetical protein